MRLSVVVAVSMLLAAIACTSPRPDGETQRVAPVYSLFCDSSAEAEVPGSVLPELTAFMKVLGRGADAESLAEWSRSPAVKVFTPDVDSVFPSLGKIESALGDILASASVEGLELPRRRYAAVVWGRPESIMFCDTVMLIALNHYLGDDYPGYSHLDGYRRRVKTPRMLPYDIAEALVATAMPYRHRDGSTVLSRLLYEGALAEAKYRLAGGDWPAALGYSEDEYAALSEHETELWELLVGKGLLFSTLPSDAERLVGPAPSTANLTDNSPGRAGRFIGHKIVRAYIAAHPDATLREMLSPEFYDSDATLREAGYVGR